MSNEEATHVSLPIEAVRDIRKSITYGLCTTVEALRIQQEKEFHVLTGKPFPDDAVPVLPEGPVESLKPFVDALLWLDVCMDELPSEKE